MLIKIKELQEHQQLNLQETISIASLRQLSDSVGEQSTAIEVKLKLEKNREVLFLQGEIKGQFNLECDLCLERFEKNWTEPLKLSLVPESIQSLLSKDTIIVQEELETLSYQGDVLDLQPLVEEQILLSLPMSNICKEDCNGLCPDCKVNLNKSSCQCKNVTGTNNPFAQLR